MSLKNLKKDNVVEKLKELLAQEKVSTILAVPSESVKGLEVNSPEYLDAVKKSLTPVYILKKNSSLFLQPSLENPNGRYIFPGDMLYLKTNEEYEIVTQNEIKTKFSVIDLNAYKINKHVKSELDLKNIDIDIIDKMLITDILRDSGMDENEIQEFIKAMDTQERKRDIEVVNVKRQQPEPSVLGDAVIYEADRVRKPSQTNNRIAVEPVFSITEREQSFISAPIPVNQQPEIDNTIIITTAAIIANRMYEDGRDTITIDELRNIANNARYLTEDQKAAAQYLADRYSEANLDNLSPDQLQDYANNIETLGGSEITDVSVEKTNETFDEILNGESRPLLPSDLDFGDAYYSEERVKRFEGNG